MLRSALRTLAALVTFGVASLAAIFLTFAVFAAIGAAIGAAGTNDQALPRSFYLGDASSKNSLLAVDVSGIILGDNTAAPPLFGAIAASYGYEIKGILANAAEDDSIGGVVLIMDTPGGTIYGSRAISDAVADYRQATNNPVVAFVAGMSASGGMYAMAGVDEIYADHGTLVGSIGVVFGPFFEYTDVVAIDGGLFGGGVTTTGGITGEYITAGRGKAFSNPWRPMTDEEKGVLQDGVNRAYDGFVASVAEGRNIEPDVIRDKIGAHLFDEETARELGLIDAVGNREEAFERAAQLAGFDQEDWRVDRYKRAGGLFGLFVSTVENKSEANSSEIPPICTRTSLLAYYGSITDFCFTTTG